MKPAVYIETTIPSFFYEVRTRIDMIARRDWTRDWWENQSERYELFTSEAVIDELKRGKFAAKEDALALISSLPLLEIDQAVVETVTTYVRQHVMPNDPTGDALHLAVASNHKCDFILTWNCRHLANANKFAHIRRINSMLGLFVPSIVTPLELVRES